MLTTLGEATLHRRYLSRPGCRDSSFPADARLGILGRSTVRARKLVCLFGTNWGFAQAADHLADHLADACGWTVSAQSVRRCCYDEAAPVERWRGLETATAAFAAAEGDVEFQTDGAMVNTVDDGWKEIRVALFLKRTAGEAARAACWEARTLPKPAARSVRVAMASCDEFAADWREWADRLGVADPAAITVLADGAKWIWRHAELQFPGSRGVLDVFHALEHLAAATRSVYGEGSGAALGGKTVGRFALLSDGWPGACEWIGRWRERCDPEHAEAVVKATEELIGYLAPHLDHLGYCERLAKGRSVGSGAIEGACKYLIGRRLKSAGGRWLPENAVRMGRLCSMHYAGDWPLYWQDRLSLAI
ncbi:MAG: hypothetical protein ACRDD1_06420 [Planctomycetia bacterium]